MRALEGAALELGVGVSTIELARPGGLKAPLWKVAMIVEVNPVFAALAVNSLSSH